MRMKIIVPAVTLLLAGSVVSQQENTPSTQQPGNRSSNSEIMRDGLELSRRERTMNVTIMAVGIDYERPEATFRESNSVIARIFITNAGDEPVPVVVRRSSRAQYRPVLLKDGRRVPYKRELLRLLRSIDTTGPISDSIRSVAVEPSQRVPVMSFDLNDWYGPIEPGRYELSIRYRFRLRGRPVESNTVTFEVIP